MPEPVFLTYRILKEKAFNADVNEVWVDWAIEMIEAGYEADSLYQLAGILKPYGQSELEALTTQVLKDLQLDYSDKRKALHNYVYYLISLNFDKPENYVKVLRELKDIYHFESDYLDFALLYWAKEDLMKMGDQHYWDGADTENIDSIIKERFEFFIREVEKRQ